MAKNNGYPIGIINDLRTKLTTRKCQQHTPTIPYNKKRWVTVNYYSPMIRCITNLFKHSDLKIAFRATYTLQQLSNQQTNTNPSRIYKVKCNTCNKAYVRQSGRSIDIRHKENIWYIRSNYPHSAYAMHILQNRHEYGTTKDTLQLLKTCRKSTHMNCWETLYVQIFHQHKILITEQQIGDINPLYELANTTGIIPCNP